MFFVYLFLLPKEQIVTEFNYFSIGQEISILKSSFGLLGPSGENKCLIIVEVITVLHINISITIFHNLKYQLKWVLLLSHIQSLGDRYSSVY